MKIIAADDERLALNLLVSSIEQAQPDAELKAFLYQSELVAAIDGGFAPDVAFLDIEMPGMSGIELAKRIKEASPKTSVVFVTGYPDYALEAYRIHARGFVTKPANVVKIREELDNLAAAPMQEEPAKRIRVQCFGSFEVFVDGTVLHFERSRTKELLAYLIDRQGAACNTAELCAVLFEDDDGSSSNRSHFRTLVSDLCATLKAYNIENLLIKQRNSFAIDPELLDCDMYRFYKGDAEAVNAYAGEYMLQYSWAEMRNGLIDSGQK